MTRRTFLAASAAAAAPVPRSRFGVARDSVRVRPYKDTIEFLEYCKGLGAAGIQAPLTDLSPEYGKRLRKRAEELGMFVELQSRLPGANMESFAALLKSAREVGALSIRVVNPGPRRYEAFKTLEEWKTAAAEAEATLKRAAPLIESMRVPVGIENHRDWTLDEFADRMRRYGSDTLGCCIDFGNNLALLDDPLAVVESLAPYAVSVHVKDIAAAEIPDGFTFTEVPLGTGLVDVKRAMALVEAKRPKAKFSIEMITRDPTPVPCLTDAYWATMPGRSGLDLARTLTLVRTKPAKFSRYSTLPREEQAHIEEDNLRRCLAFSA